MRHDEFPQGSGIVRPFWWTHVLPPMLAGLTLIACLRSYGLDEMIGHFFYDNAAQRWIGSNAWWANDMLYRHGKHLVYATAAMALLALFTGWLSSNQRGWLRPAGYFLLCMGLSTGSVGLLKRVTRMDCPRDLIGFGGLRPDIGLFQQRPAGLPDGRCFPGGHSSGGFSFLALYFLMIERSRIRACAGLAFGLTIGGAFAVAQWARGSHFPSHDLSSALIAWLVALSVYTVVYRRRLWVPPEGLHAPVAD